jgi:hypothetical protein
LEFEDVWLEVRACSGGGQAAGPDERMLLVSAVSEVLEAAANTNKHLGMWDYSRRLSAGEEKLVRSAIRFTSTAEDSRSVPLSANVEYKGSCYTLTLFAIKKSQ